MSDENDFQDVIDQFNRASIAARRRLAGQPFPLPGPRPDPMPVPVRKTFVPPPAPSHTQRPRPRPASDATLSRQLKTDGYTGDPWPEQ